MRQLPREKALDSTLALLNQGYTFISSRCNQYGTDAFRTRLMLTPFICIRGEDAARVFYDPHHIKRHGTLPAPAKNTLLGHGAVMQLDDEAHRWRKQMFMRLMGPEHLGALARITERQWHAHAAKWETMDRVVLLDEAQELLCRAVCEWAGVPLAAGEARRRADDFAALIDAPVALGMRHVRGLRARARSDAWVQGIIERVRGGTLHAPEGGALHVIAWHRDLQGELLDAHVAAVELINVLRPTVAISWYVAFVALALHQHPQYRAVLQGGAERDVEHFVHEVRRTYSFFPFIAGRVRETFEFGGYRFEQGRMVMLDLYGTNHDARLWPEPHEFRPQRFETWNGGPFNFIPQGGGDHFANHRCAGEWVTIELMKVAARFLTRSVTYEVPAQDLRVRLSRMPMLPHSHVVLTNVRRTPEPTGG